MSKLGVHIGPHPTGLAAYLGETYAAGSPVPLVFGFDQDVRYDVDHDSPITQIVFRTQKLGADTGQMYAGDDAAAHLQGHAWVQALAPIWRLNAAAYYAVINEPGVNDAPRLQWLMHFFMGCMEEAQSLGFRLCVGEWSSGMPPLDPQFIAIYTPMLRMAKMGGHILGLHEYGLTGPMMSNPPNPLILRYRQFYALLPDDARPMFAITEAGSGAGYDTGLNGQAYIDDAGLYDREIMQDRYVLGACLFRLGQGESNLATALPLLTQWVIDHPTPIESNQTLEERVAQLELSLRAALTEHAVFQQQSIANDAAHTVLNQVVSQHGLTLEIHEQRIEALEVDDPPPPNPVTAQISVFPTAITAGQTALLTWETAGATNVIIPPFGPQALNGSKTVLPTATTEYVLTASGPGGTAQARATLTVTPPVAVIWQWSGVGVGDNQPLTPMVLGAFDRAKSVINSAKLFTMPDGGLMRDAITAIRNKRADTFIMARLFFSVNYGSKFTPADFVAFCANGLAAAYSAGVRYFEIHNEPNYPGEGQGFNWSGGTEFAQWLLGVLAIVKPMYPDAKWGYPGLTSQPDTGSALQFFRDSQAAVAACDWVGAHSYFWNDTGTGYGMTSPDGGMWWKRLRSLTTKPLLITEFSCNTPAVDYATKGAWYRRYLDLLKTEPQLLGAVCFALSWPGSDPNREGWVYNNKITAIPTALVLQESAE